MLQAGETTIRRERRRTHRRNDDGYAITFRGNNEQVLPVDAGTLQKNYSAKASFLQ